MPEGPECRHIAQKLAKIISNKTIIDIDVLSGRFIKKTPNGIESFREQLPVKVVGAGVHGKFIYIICADESYIWSTLGMTGEWSSVANKYSRIKLTLSDGRSAFFNDQRNFGTIKFVRGRHKMLDKLKSFGPDLLSEDVTDQKFISQIRTKPAWEITKVLMEQSIISGVGNYIKSDSLWLARIDPTRCVKDITDGELANLNRCIKQVMRESYNSGSTLETYYAGNNQLPKGRKYLIYNQTTDPDGNTIKKQRTKDNRMTYWVPNIQK